MKRLLFALSILLISAPVSQAHTALVSATPGEGAIVTELPANILLTFNEDLMVLGNKTINTVSLFSPDGSEISGITSVTDGSKLTATIPATQSNLGKYTVKYRITSADGHPVEGSYNFTIEKMAAPDLNNISTDDDGGGEEGEAFTKIGGAIVILGFLTLMAIRKLRK